VPEPRGGAGTSSTEACPRTVRIGCGAGFAEDRIDPAVDLAERGALEYLVFECLAERTIALAQLERRRDPERGFDPLLHDRMAATLGACMANGVSIVTNAGAANPAAAARLVAEVAREAGLGGLRIAVVLGDDVTALVDESDTISANAYLGAEPVVAALACGADVVVAGRVADASLFVGPLLHALGWAPDDWHRVGTAVAVGHLLECAGQVTGGYFAEPGVKSVGGLANLGFPLAEVGADGAVVITKLPGTGGVVDVRTCTEQLLYEIHDPASYVTADAIADFSGVTFEQLGPDRVAMRGATGRPRPDHLKVSLGYADGFVGEGEISYAGRGCVDRARLAIEIVQARVRHLSLDVTDLRCEVIGIDSVHRGRRRDAVEPTEVRVRVAGRAATAAAAEALGREVTGLWVNGPAGGGGARRSVSERVGVRSTFVARERVRPVIEWVEA
jgi:hypothetical protein